jgi:glycosyltransferase involved in cell wall biosynthesis
MNEVSMNKPSASKRMDNHSTRPPTVSVLMPCYNAAATIDEILESLIKQTSSDFEIVAVDDGSEDDTREKLEAWAKEDHRIAPVFLPHGGIIPALNAGLQHCRGPFIARMDADDLAHPERLERQVEYLEKHSDIAAVGCLVEGFPADTIREGFRIYIDWLNRLVTPEAIAREIYIESPIAHPSIMIRRSWLEQMGGYEEHGWAEDYDLWLRMHLAGAKFAKVEEILLYWRENPERLTRTDSRYSVENFIRAKANYLCQGPLLEFDGVIIWGAGQMGRRISKHLLRNGAMIRAFIDVDPKKIGRELRGSPVVSREVLPELLAEPSRTIILAAVSSRGARELIREHLNGLGLREGIDWWAVA